MAEQTVTVAQVSEKRSKDKKPSLGQEWKELKRHFFRNVVKTVVWQRRPVTIVIATFVAPDGTHHTNVGISKVCHPDEWKPFEGEKIAYHKAATNAAKDYIFAKYGMKLTNDANRGVKEIHFTRHYVWQK